MDKEKIKSLMTHDKKEIVMWYALLLDRFNITDADIEAQAKEKYYKEGITDIGIVGYNAYCAGAKEALNGKIKHNDTAGSSKKEDA